ncbi:hypothetical protein FACS189416_4370 [Bacteroidia bacterium]|nr:hypothetical protein FACS189416_4370 [Bacteroidia bacterium]
MYADYPIQLVNLTQVELTDSFWLPRIQTIQHTTIQYAFDKCEEEGRFENFVTAGKVMNGGTGKVRGSMPFDDTDVYKTIEGAAYSLISAPDLVLEKYVDSVIAIVKIGQEPDGYLTTWRTIDPKTPPCNWVKPGGDRWFDLGSSHELYNSGHMFEAASAHYRATGKHNFLDIALKNADLLVKMFGDSANYKVPGHEIIETGLVKLYQITGEDKYLKLSKKFLDNRGDSIHRDALYGAYNQDHIPVTQQDEVVGHAVRAVYLYAGMTDIAAIYEDPAYRAAIDKLWENMVDKKMYITGGIGARHRGESFGKNYELPNLTAYSETCAAIGSVYWNERLFRLTGQSKYYDVLERTLYNALIAGISQTGTEFFYPNPLEADGKFKFNQGALTRQAWFDCSCCPTNLIRFIPYVPNLIYATQNDIIYVNLFMSNKASIPLENGTVHIEQHTNYPWTGDIHLQVKPQTPQRITVKIRIPGWSQNEVAPGSLYTYRDYPADNYSLTVNGQRVESGLKDGYVEITKEWTGNEEVILNLPMKVRQVKANKLVADDAKKTAIEYGPLVYCVEEIDNATDFDKITLPTQALFTKTMKPDLLGGMNVISESATGRPHVFIPYYAWSNRGVGKMKVWLDTK